MLDKSQQLPGSADTLSGSTVSEYQGRCWEAVYEEALTKTVQAELFILTGQREEATALLDEARSTATTLQAKPLLERVAELENRPTGRITSVAMSPAGLSPREVEVLQLLAQGLTDGEIASQLYISPRTVGGHLRSIYNKAGVSSRAAATAFAFEHNLV